MLPYSFRSGLGLLVFCALLSCGGGGGGGSAGIDGSGAPAIAVVSGPINGFGSVIVNGVHYNTDGAEFWVRGVRATEAELNVGSYIHLEGTTSADGKEGVAKLIYFQPNVIGAVSSVDPLAETFVVLGQTVQLTNDTALDFAFSPRDINGIRVGQQVEVSGPLNAEGEVIATRVGLMQTPAKELAGAIADLNLFAQTFRINNITVSYAKTSNLPPLVNGQKVILRGATVVNGQLQPRAIELEQKPQIPQGQLITQTGLITRFDSVQDFTLGNFDVTTTTFTVFERSKASDLKLNARATVVGRLVGGKLLAEKITLVADVEWKIQGPITDMRSMGAEGGEIKVQGNWLKLTPATRVDSELSMAGDRMKFAYLRINDFVVLTGHLEGGRQVVTSIEREDRPQLNVEKKVLGYVQKAPLREEDTSFLLEPKLTVLLEGSTQFYDNGVPISKEQFVQKAAGKFVTVYGVMLDDGGFSTYTATSVQITPTPGRNFLGPKASDKPLSKVLLTNGTPASPPSLPMEQDADAKPSYEKPASRKPEAEESGEKELFPEPATSGGASLPREDNGKPGKTSGPKAEEEKEEEEHEAQAAPDTPEVQGLQPAVKAASLRTQPFHRPN